MMKFEIYILQKKSQDPKMYQEAMGEYLKRLGAYAKVSVVYKKNAKQVEKILKEPGEHYHILPGRDSMTSPGLAQLINESSVQGISKVSFLYWRFRIRGSKAISCIVIYTKWFASRHDHIRTDLSLLIGF